MKPLKLYLITDTHYFKNSLGAFGKEYEEFMEGEQKCFAETESINKATFKYLESANEADILLIAGGHKTAAQDSGSGRTAENPLSRFAAHICNAHAQCGSLYLR